MRFHPRAVLLATTACLTLGQSLPAAAQAEGNTILGVITYFADRIGRALTDVQGHVSVIDRDDLTERNVQNIEDLLRHVPGVEAVRQVSSADPFGGQSGFRIRGVEGNRVQTLVDGARIPERIIDGSRDYLDFNFTRQVDLVRGPASVLWGADALGGVVALETIRPADLIREGSDRGGTVEVGYSEVTASTNVAVAFAQRFGDLSLLVGQARTVDHEMRLTNADPTGGAWGCTRAVIYGSVDCGHFNPLDRTTDRTLVKLDWALSDTQTLSLIADRMLRLSEVTSTTSYSATTFQNDRIRDISRTHWGLSYESRPAGFIDDLRVTLGYTPGGYDQTATSLIRDPATGEISESIAFTALEEAFFEVDVQATARFATGGADHVLTFGFDGDRTSTDYARWNSTRNLTAGTDPVTSVPNSWNFADGSTTRADLYIQDQITLLDGRLELTPGLRFATFRMEPQLNGAVTAMPDAPLDPREEQRILASLGATWNIDDRHSVWAHYGQGFKMPTFQQLFTSSSSSTGTGFDFVPAPWLVPEEVESIEIGLRGVYGNGFWSVNAFQADYTDFIESFWFVPGTNDISYRNLSAVTTWGIEAEAAFDLSDRLQVTGSFAWMDGEQRATADSDPTPHLVPPLTAILGASYEIPSQDLTLTAHATFAGETRPTSDLNFTPPAYQVVDLGARWAFTENAVLNLQVNNLFDEKYYNMQAAGQTIAPSSATSGAVPVELQTGAGRNIALTVGFTF